MDEASVRYTNAVLIDDEQRTHLGDFLLHADGTWSESKGDEDVVHNFRRQEEIDYSFFPKLAHPLAYATQCKRFLRWTTSSGVVGEINLPN